MKTPAHDRIALPAALSIAGSDPSGGAGIQADLKTFAAFGVYGGAVITALTAQNGRAFHAALPVDAGFVSQQLEAVLDDIAFGAIKIGMLGTAPVARAVASVLRDYSNDHIVIDPVLAASAGGRLLDDDGLTVLRDELFPLARIITPNAIEAGVLLGRPAPATVAEMHDAARDLSALGPAWVLVTGGHVDAGDTCVDVLLERGGESHELRSSRERGPGRHGTGCTHSSAIAAMLAHGERVPVACEQAQAYVGGALIASEEFVSAHEPGPLVHIMYSPFGGRASV